MPNEQICWTCGEDIPDAFWDQAPREQSDPYLRMCFMCFNVISSSFDPLYATNMIRHVAGITRIGEWGPLDE